MDLIGTVLTLLAVVAFWTGLWVAAAIFAPDTRDGRDWRSHPALQDRPPRVGD